jgi:chromosome segregation ATPase
MKSKLINTTSTIKSSTNSTSSVSSDYGNTLRDATLQFQLDNEVGNHLKVAINGSSVEIYLLSKTNNILGGGKFNLEIEAKELVSVSLDSDNKRLDFLFDDDSHIYADLSSLYSLVETEVNERKEAIEKVIQDTTDSFNAVEDELEVMDSDIQTNKENINKVVDQVNEYIEETDEHLENLDNYTSSLQSSLDTLTKKEKADVLSLSNEITSINDKIPTEATSTNQLADKDFVNSSIATATATFRGTVSSKEELKKLTGDLNDYAYIEVKDETTGLTLRYDRYKYTTTVSTETGNWAFEYSLNNSSFTAEQWAAINSTITKDLVNQISTNKADIVDLNTRVTNNEEDIATLKNDLSNEVTRATNAEEELQTNIDTEQYRAQREENDIRDNLSEEVTNRETADTTLQTNIDTEVTRATTKEAELEAAIKEAGKVDDVKVATPFNSNYVSIVADKIAKLDLTEFLPFKQSYIDDVRDWVYNGLVKTKSNTANLPWNKTCEDNWGVLMFVQENSGLHNGIYIYWDISEKGDYGGSMWLQSRVNSKYSDWTRVTTEKDLETLKTAITTITDALDVRITTIENSLATLEEVNTMLEEVYN